MSDSSLLNPGTYQFDLGHLGRELDARSGPARYAAALIPSLLVALSVLFTAYFLPDIRAGSMSPVYWLDLSMIYGFTGVILCQSRHLVWQLGRAATSVVVSDREVVLRYPGGRVGRLAWDDTGSFVVLDDFSTFNNWPLSTPYLLTERGRTSALTRDAFATILAKAKERASVTAGPGRRPFVFRSFTSPLAWRITGRSA
jgi:hypothetical protein